jgi:hypothetical protein
MPPPEPMPPPELSSRPLGSYPEGGRSPDSCTHSQTSIATRIPDIAARIVITPAGAR